jgi:RNA polymerase sigma factor (sigma-70 family)
MGDPELPDSDNLERWMQAAQGGDAAAYARLLEAAVPIVRRVVARRGGFENAADEEDVLQEVLVSLHAVRATYDPSRPFLPWLLAIARHRVADLHRRHQRTRGREVALDAAETVGADDSAIGHIATRDDGERLHRAIAALPPAQRRAITLLKLRELSLREAAAESGMTTGSLKVATHRALATLRRLLASTRNLS